MAVKPENPKYIPKPYEQMTYPGQRVQIDVKFVPAVCIVGAATGQKFYQYTAIDEFSRHRYLEAFEENNTYSSTQFLIHMLDHFKKLGFSVECVQTDNGFEFTKRFGGSAPDNLSLFERALKEIPHLLLVITAKLNVRTAKIMSTSMLRTNSIHLRISKHSLPFIFANTTISSCALLTGTSPKTHSQIFCASA